jgi:hypothetical protein
MNGLSADSELFCGFGQGKRWWLFRRVHVYGSSVGSIAHANHQNLNPKPIAEN